MRLGGLVDLIKILENQVIASEQYNNSRKDRTTFETKMQLSNGES